MKVVNQSSAMERVPVAICGDDLVAAWTVRHTQEYHRQLLEVGLVANTSKEYRSTTGAVFVEKLFRLKRCSQTMVIPLKRHRVETNNLWEWIKVQIPNTATTKRKTVFYKVFQVQRPLLSAVVQAKRHARNSSGKRNNQDVPQHFTLGPCIAEESDKCTEPWRKTALLQFAKQVHAKLVNSMERSGVPLHFPQSLGGWGFPGKQGAPVAFRKAAAVSATGNTELVKRFSNIFLTSSAPNRLRKQLKAGLKSISDCPERFDSTEKVQTKPVLDLQSEFVSRTLAYHAMDPTKSKLATKRYASVGSTAKRVRDTVYKLGKMWKSVKPIKASNALSIAARYDTRKVDGRYLDQLLMLHGVFDSVIKGYLDSPEIEFRLTTEEDLSNQPLENNPSAQHSDDDSDDTPDGAASNPPPQKGRRVSSAASQDAPTQTSKGDAVGRISLRDVEQSSRLEAILSTRPRAITDSTENDL